MFDWLQNLDWLQNPWIVSLGVGIPSGLIVNFLTRRLFSRKDRREYNQNVLSANREIVYALRPGISEGHIADRYVVERLIRATARKYSVAETDLNDPIQVGEELMKEIMDSSFISSKTKREYCGQLNALMVESVEGDPEIVVLPSENRFRSPSELEEYRARLVRRTAAMLGAFTTTMTITLVLYNSSILDGRSLSPALVGAVAAGLVSVTALVVQALGRRATKETEEAKHRVHTRTRFSGLDQDESNSH